MRFRSEWFDAALIGAVAGRASCAPPRHQHAYGACEPKHHHARQDDASDVDFSGREDRHRAIQNTFSPLSAISALPASTAAESQCMLMCMVAVCTSRKDCCSRFEE